jgi:hypothetical protein
MSVSTAVSLAAMFGKPAADKLIKSLTARKDGVRKFEEASLAMVSGLTLIEAMKRSFGKDFLAALNEVLGTSPQAGFSYEAGTQSYIRSEGVETVPAKMLRAEININLDRLSLVDAKGIALKSQFRGLVSVWKERCLQFFGSTHEQDIESTLNTIDTLLRGEVRNYRQIYELLSSTALGGMGALMVIAGVLAATGTGVGILSAISLFLFGVPWLTVGALVLPGALLVVLATRKVRPVDDISLSIALAYRLLDRMEPERKT